MNERIKELAKQAQVDGDAIHYYSQQFAEKFAELIVNDVLGCYAAIDNGNLVEGTEDFIDAVIKRYGIGKNK